MSKYALLILGLVCGFLIGLQICKKRPGSVRCSKSTIHNLVLYETYDKLHDYLKVHSDVNSKTKSCSDWRNDGCTPLLLTAYRVDVATCSNVVQLLLTFGADKVAVDSAGRNALHHAVLSRNIDFGYELLQQGLDPFRADSAGQSAFELAVLDAWPAFVMLVVSRAGIIHDTTTRYEIVKAIEYAKRSGQVALSHDLRLSLDKFDQSVIEK